MGRPNDIHLTPQAADWLADPRVRAVCDAVASDGAGIYFVGGCVRNALMGRPVSDVDLSTPSRPEDVTRKCEAAGLRVVPTGVGHGTVTVVSGGQGFEVTTFRKDVATDGRRATVAFTDDIAEDARRRDFTMNALYATPDGRVIDPLGGLPDLQAGRVRFIEDAAQRIKEDYLRILRFFRFSAWYGDAEAGFEAETFAAIAAHLDGLVHLSKERIGAEMKKLLEAPDPAPAVAAMERLGVLQAILPGSDARFLPILLYMEGEAGLTAAPMTRLAALGGEEVADNLRLSKAEANTLAEVAEAAQNGQAPAEVAYRKGADVALQAILLRAALTEQPPRPEEKDQIARGASASFPLSARDLMPEYTGKALGERLQTLEQAWIESGFALGREDLMRLAGRRK